MHKKIYFLWTEIVYKTDSFMACLFTSLPPPFFSRMVEKKQQKLSANKNIKYGLN